MSKNMKYILEEGIIKNGQKKCQKSNQGHDAGAILLNQNNCKKFDLIDDTLTHQNNKTVHDNLSTTFTGISYIKVKQYSPKDKHTYTSALKGNIIIERDGYEFAVIKGDAAIKGGKTFLFLVDNVVEIEVHYKDNYYKHLKCWGLIDNTNGYMIVYNPINKNEEGGKMYLNDNAVKEITDLLNKVKEVVDFVHDLGITYQSDSWNATVPSDYDYENILTWTKEHFQHIDITNIDHFVFGGSVCDHEHKWKENYVTGPKELHQAKVNVVKEYLQKVVDNFKSQYFKIGNVRAEDIYDNCGWECNVDFAVTPIKPKCLEKSINQELIDQIKKEISIDYEYDEKECNAETGIKPEGYFAYMLEHFSDLVDPNDVEYEGNFGYNGKYIRDVMKLINKTEEKAKLLREKYEKYGVVVTIGDFNVGCEYGMTIYIWIPYQTQKKDESNKPYYH